MQCLKVKVSIAQLCPTLFNPMDCSPPCYRMQCLSIICTQIPVQSVIRKQPTLWILLNCLNLKGMLVCPPLVSNPCHYWDSHLRSSGFCGLFWDCLKKQKNFFFKTRVDGLVLPVFLKRREDGLSSKSVFRFQTLSSMMKWFIADAEKKKAKWDTHCFPVCWPSFKGRVSCYWNKP